MSGIFKQLTPYSLSLLLLSATTVYAADTTPNNLDTYIRNLVETLLKEKDKKIQQLEARIEKLDHLHQATSVTTPVQPNLIVAPLTKPLQPESISPQTHLSLVRKLNALGIEIGKLKRTSADRGIPVSRFFNASTPSSVSLLTQLGELDEGIIKMKQALAEGNADISVNVENKINADNTPLANTFISKLDDLGHEVAELKQTVEKKGLYVGGFMDVTARTDNSSNQNFNIGYVELDLEYAYDEHFAASSALIYSAIPGTRAGNYGAWGTGIAVALLDYHLFDSSIPPRGRIFNDQGFHIQAGRFDLPFSTDYQYFANTDRITITAPLTTTRMQFFGFNSDGFRSYGSWKHLNYSAFWTDAVYAPDGNSVGGRLGMNFGRNPYKIHNVYPDGIEVGFSHLSDLDGQRNVRHALYGADLSIGYRFLTLQSELLWLRSRQPFVDDNGVNYGKPHELGYHATLIADLESFIHHPVLAVARYGRWQPEVSHTKDYNFDERLIPINDVSALTLALKYTFSDHFKLKFEYTDSLGTSTEEHYFDKRVGSAQMVVAF